MTRLERFARWCRMLFALGDLNCPTCGRRADSISRRRRLNLKTRQYEVVGESYWCPKLHTWEKKPWSP